VSPPVDVLALFALLSTHADDKRMEKIMLKARNKFFIFASQLSDFNFHIS